MHNGFQAKTRFLRRQKLLEKLLAHEEAEINIHIYIPYAVYIHIFIHQPPRHTWQTDLVEV